MCFLIGQGGRAFRDQMFDDLYPSGGILAYRSRSAVVVWRSDGCSANDGKGAAEGETPLYGLVAEGLTSFPDRPAGDGDHESDHQAGSDDEEAKFEVMLPPIAKPGQKRQGRMQQRPDTIFHLGDVG
ncbi:MAG: hypothetical protein D6820_04440 [Lentisphaerae bacterium]|nr:MAG: hypothetical protein D6820_04440 [Lentisphaerota bacterium]